MDSMFFHELIYVSGFVNYVLWECKVNTFSRLKMGNSVGEKHPKVKVVRE